ncbi:MAG: NUDIX hydrolase [Verrucomicrobiota bacterium]
MQKRKILYRGKWLTFCETLWETAEGKEKSWEFATRPTTAGAVCIFALKRGEPDLIILVKQFRPPLAKSILELPAGLIEPGHSVEETALKELREETGYLGHILHTGPAVYNSPGLTDENVTAVTVEITGRTDQALEEDEMIEVVEVPLNDLRHHLESFHRDGLCIDAKLWYLATGLAFSALNEPKH